MARRRYGRRRRGRSGFKIPVISLAILLGQAALSNRGNFLNSAASFASLYTGFDLLDGSFEARRLLLGYGPWLVKRFVLPIARPRMPIHGLPISLS